jgi:uncharacterized damage-inducible protein DinB
MSNLESVARVVRWGTESMAFNLGHIPADKLNWKPTETSKSAMEMTGEVISVMRMMLGMLSGAGFPEPAADTAEGGPRHPVPASLEEAQSQLTEAGEAFAAALEAAGPELERTVETPYGTMWGPRVVLWGMIDLVHHHGQIAYIQTLLGDAEMHFNPQGTNWFAPDA